VGTTASPTYGRAKEPGPFASGTIAPWPGRLAVPGGPRRHRLHQQSLRGQVAGRLGKDYSSAQMSYDLRRLRLHGLIERQPGTNFYALTPDGLRVALFYSKLRARLLGPLLEADQPPAPLELRRALATISRITNEYITNARLGLAA
jgi:hypothetical protein